ncbi:MAG: iron-containing alcohol dehydrogenase family protein [Pseudanabaenaceae cyanobacterium SKYGB_i_bin29]|nr:iron-containing alcohol dehydrogenase family protein [Pseudanabaenaceae cyanobacterium SKYG29]MDW8421986.1 iron-containing alcohol dehydrogenase family protein [Pseudanabaenaceae cyanobacterium SKYGB_i_bin29]
MPKATSIAIAPSRVLKGKQVLPTLGEMLQGERLFAMAGQRAWDVVSPYLKGWDVVVSEPIGECCEAQLERLQQQVAELQPTFLLGIGGGKVLDTAKFIADRCQLPIATIPTSGATCAAWTALSNIYSEAGAFLYDVALGKCPDVVVIDYEILATAPPQTILAGIGDALAKWYEASVSSGSSEATLVISAVQAARVLRDILFQKGQEAVEHPGSAVWQEVMDGTIVMAGLIGGLGGAQCRTVAAHAIHNGLTHLPLSHHKLHGEKVAYGILVQLRLEELQGNQLAATARQQLLQFYHSIGLPCSLEDLGLGNISLNELHRVAEIACQPRSDIHRLPFSVSIEQVQAAMVSTTAPLVRA